MNNSCKKYCKDIKLLLPLRGKREELLFNNIELRLSELCGNKPAITYEGICSVMGTPQEIVSEYYCNAEIEYLAKKLKFTLYIRNAFIGLMITLLLISGMRNYYLNKVYQLIEDTNVIREVETVE